MFDDNCNLIHAKNIKKTHYFPVILLNHEVKTDFTVFCFFFQKPKLQLNQVKTYSHDEQHHQPNYTSIFFQLIC